MGIMQVATHLIWLGMVCFSNERPPRPSTVAHRAAEILMISLQMTTLQTQHQVFSGIWEITADRY